jgi:hypothetical protein
MSEAHCAIHAFLKPVSLVRLIPLIQTSVGDLAFGPEPRNDRRAWSGGCRSIDRLLSFASTLAQMPSQLELQEPAAAHQYVSKVPEPESRM